MRLLHLEVGDAVAQQAADAVVLLEDGHVVARARELLGGGESRRAGADDGDLAAGAQRGLLRHDPALVPRAVGDRVLDGLDAHRVVIDVEHARGLARRRADAAGELGEVVRRVQHRGSVLPLVRVHQVVEVRNDVVDRAAAVAERRAAVHAARGLHLGVVDLQADDEFLVVLQARLHGRVALLEALVLHEAGDFSHDLFLMLVAARRPLRGRRARSSGCLTWRGRTAASRRPCQSSPWRS